MTEEIEASPKLSKTGLIIKRDAEALAEMERKILEFLEQQHPDSLSNSVVRHAINAIHFKIHYVYQLYHQDD